MSITDPGNANGAISVGATHRYRPHEYGVSYFSSRGPTGDGRSKPDLVAPGEKIRSTVIAIERVMVSHMDQDHIKGILDMLFECDEANADHQTPLVAVKGLWHNSFTDVIGGLSRADKVEQEAL